MEMQTTKNATVIMACSILRIDISRLFKKKSLKQNIKLNKVLEIIQSWFGKPYAAFICFCFDFNGHYRWYIYFVVITIQNTLFIWIIWFKRGKVNWTEWLDLG
jgi:hypothetical protein